MPDKINYIYADVERRAVSKRIKIGDKTPVKPLFAEVAHEFSLQPEILLAIADYESKLNPWAVNISGVSYYPKSKGQALAIINKRKKRSFDVGLMQVNSFWLRKFNINTSEAFDPEKNIRLGAWILRYCLDKYGYNWKAIGAYHTGNPRNLPKRAKLYAVRVLSRFKKNLKVKKKSL